MARNLVVLTFDDMASAAVVHDALASAAKQGLVHIDDAAVVVKNEDGTVKVDNQVASGTWVSTAVGGGLGLLLGTVFFPLGGLVLGLAGGALVGKAMDLGVDGKFVKDVGEKIEPGTSALFILAHDANTAGVLAVLREHKGGHVLQTTLDPEAEDAIRRALGDK